MSRRKIKHYHDECWQQSFWFMIGWPDKIAKKEIHSRFPGFDREMCFGTGKTLYKDDGSMPIIIWTRQQKNKIKKVSIIAHECIHAANICLGQKGVKISPADDEPLAYLAALLVTKALS